MAKCELCELRDYTQRYCQFVHPFSFVVLDCDSCETPMAVLGDHRQSATGEERAFMIEVLSAIGRQKFGADRFVIDDVMRQIPDHCHIPRPTAVVADGLISRPILPYFLG